MDIRLLAMGQRLSRMPLVPVVLTPALMNLGAGTNSLRWATSHYLCEQRMGGWLPDFDWRVGEDLRRDTTRQGGRRDGPRYSEMRRSCWECDGTGAVVDPL